MARPQKNNVDYFSHDTDMRNHRKIKALRTKFGIAGYGIWCMLLEHIGSCDHMIAKWDEIEIEMVAGDFGVSVTEIQEVVSFCDRLELLQINDKTLKSLSMIERLQPLIQKRERERKRVSVAESPQSKVKKSKVKLFTYVNNSEDISEQIKNKIKDFIEHRISIKKPMTEQAVKLFLGKVLKLQKDYEEKEIIEMIETAIMNGWQSIYPKDEKTKQAHEKNRDDFTF